MFTSTRRSFGAQRKPSLVPRREERQAVQKTASLTVPESGETVAGTIRDIHSKGARISVYSHHGVPDKFFLKCRSEMLETWAQVVWRRGNELGVRFVPR